MLNQRVFPASIRAVGGATALGANFSVNCMINLLFPFVVQTLSGGPSGNQRRGFALSFFGFAVLSVVSTTVLYLMIQSQTVTRRQQQQRPGPFDAFDSPPTQSKTSLTAGAVQSTTFYGTQSASEFTASQ